MKKDIDNILKQALTPTDEPNFWLNQKILNQTKETVTMKNKKAKRIPAIVLSAALILSIGSITTYAAWKYLTPDKVAEVAENKKLTDAFKSKNAISVNETQSYAGFDVTLLGVVSGVDISESIEEINGTIDNNKTYAVVAIKNSDGTPMPHTSEDEYGNLSFFVSPLIKGYNPNQYNAVTMRGGYQDLVQDGILYRIGECDNVEMFADHNLYLCVSDSTFYNNEAYHYDEATGEISRNSSYDGVNALFKLPLDKAKADPKAVEAYIKNMEAEQENPVDSDVEVTEIDEWIRKITPENIDEYAVRVEETVKVLTPDKDGYINSEYEYNGSSGSGTSLFSDVFPDAKIGMSKNIDASYSDRGFDDLILETYTLNEDGTITFAIYVPKK